MFLPTPFVLQKEMKQCLNLGVMGVRDHDVYDHRNSLKHGITASGLGCRILETECFFGKSGRGIKTTDFHLRRDA